MTPRIFLHLVVEVLGIIKRIILSNLGGAPTRGVMMLIEDDRGRVLLVKNKYRKMWTIPGGWVDPGESFVDAARREVAEETGVMLQGVPTFMTQLAGPHHTDQLFRGIPSGETIAVSTPWEIEATRWCAPADLPVLAKPAQRILGAAGIIVGVVESPQP